MKTGTLKIYGFALAMAATTITGCGGGDGGGTAPAAGPTQVQTAGQSGKVTQGPVDGATVWADSLDGGTRFVIDANELASKTTSRPDGTFTLPVQPAYKYVIVSQGGTDTITNKPATTMLAPAGSSACSPLTTVVVLDTTGTLAAKINAMLPAGTTFSSDLSANNALSPAALLLVKTIETTVATLNQAVVDSATTGGKTVSTTQQSGIQLNTYSNIAETLAASTQAQLAQPAALTASMNTAVTQTITDINAAVSTNVTIPLAQIAAVATAISTNSVAAAAQVVAASSPTNAVALAGITAANVASSVATVTSGPSSVAMTEATAVNTGANLATLNNAVTTTATAASTSVTVSVSTPAAYVPPATVIPVVNNPNITAYVLTATPTATNWVVSNFTISFSDAMDAATSGTGVLNPANVTFTGGSCAPASYANKILTISCPAGIASGTTLTVTLKGTIAGSLGGSLLVDNTKSFIFPSTTGSTGGSAFTMF